MKETINYRFNNFKRIDTGATITLSKAVRGMKYGKQIVINAFNKFVPKDEYVKDEKDEILEDLLSKNFSDSVPENTYKIRDLKKANALD